MLRIHTSMYIFLYLCSWSPYRWNYWDWTRFCLEDVKIIGVCGCLIRWRIHLGWEQRQRTSPLSWWQRWTILKAHSHLFCWKGSFCLETNFKSTISALLVHWAFIRLYTFFVPFVSWSKYWMSHKIAGKDNKAKNLH